MKYIVENKFERKIGEFTTRKEAVKFAVNYIRSVITELSNDGRYTGHIELDLNDLLEYRKTIGTKFEAKPDKTYFGRYINIVCNRT